MWLVIATFRLLASLWTPSDSHRVSSNGRRWAREHTPHLAVMCTPGVRISVSNVVRTSPPARVSREDTHTRCVNAGAGARAKLLRDSRLHTALTVMLLVAAGRLQGRLVLPGWVVAVPTPSGLVPTERRVCR
jgi:hypothetical protein